MLFHAPVQRYIILFGPATQRVQQQHRLFVASLQQTTLSVLHQERMAVVHRITQLECKNGICKGKAIAEGFVTLAGTYGNDLV